MRLPPVTPLEENYLCKNRGEFLELVKRTLSKGGGAFFKVLGKVDGEPYYVTLLIDDEKILAVEVQDVRGGSQLVGKPALELLKEMLECGPVIADAFPMSDVDVKMSVVENMDVYNATPKMPLREMCPGAVEKTEEKGEERSPPNIERERKERVKPEILINVPPQVDAYARRFAGRIVKYANSLGITVKRVKIEAEEVRYALGAGKGIHSTVELEGESKSHLPYQRLKEEIEKFTYREAAELSKALGEKVVVSRFTLRL